MWQGKLHEKVEREEQRDISSKNKENTQKSGERRRMRRLNPCKQLREDNKGVQFPRVSLKKWQEKHDLKVSSVVCEKCGVKKHTLIPVVTKDCYGLVTPYCKCLKAGTNSANLVFRDELFAQRLKKLFNKDLWK